MRNLAPGSRLGRFEIVAVVGEGAMGVVYLANDPEIERRVAIKTLRAISEAGVGREELETRFLKEAKLAGRLQHPNVVTVYEVGRDGDLSFIAMEYVEGEPLNRVSDPEANLDLAARLDIVRQVALALQHAHSRGVLHRDVKPGNILVTPDRRVKVADFGIGKLLTSGSADLTRTGQMLGSPAYMSPEQIRGEKLDGRSDLFSLGVVCYELLAGARPFPGDSITTLVYQILHTEPRDPRELRADLPPATRDVFARLLAKAPDRRPADAAAFLREIRRIEEELKSVEPTQAIPLRPSRPATPTRPSPPRPTSPSAPAPSAAPPSGRGAGPLYLFGAAALVIAIGFLLWTLRASERRESHAAAAPTPGVSAVPAPATIPSAPPSAAPPPEPSSTAVSLPTPGPARAADAIVGAARVDAGAPSPRPRRQSPIPSAEAAPAEPTPVLVAADKSEPSGHAPASSAPADNVYRARRFAKFSGGPAQARVYLDGRYVGIVDDWDDHGGGKTLPLAAEATHRVRLELPGYRTLNLDVITSSGAKDETVDVDEELTRESRVDFPKLKSPFDRTVGPVEFLVDPPDALVSENGKTLGSASSFGPSSPLRLAGPMVHDLLLSAPGRESRSLRILVSSNADRDVARVRLALKKQ